MNPAAWKATVEAGNRVWPMDFLLSKAQRANTMDETQANAVYELVAKGFAELGGLVPRCISRSFLLRDSCYAGQVWRCEGFQAIWLLDGDSVAFSEIAGNRVKTLTLVPEETRKAA